MIIDLLHEEEYELLRKRLREEAEDLTEVRVAEDKNLKTDYRIRSFNAMLATLSTAAVIIIFALIVLANI